MMAMMSNGRPTRGNGRKRKGTSMGGSDQLANLEQMFPLHRASRLSAPSSSTAPPATNTQQRQILCVKWDKFNTNMVSVFSRLRDQGHFIDVLLWCEGKTVKCHKIVLCAGSTYFQNLLVDHPEPGDPLPIIFLNNMSFSVVEALVEFMYKGVVNVQQDKLQSLLDAAEALKIKGLGSDSGSNSNNASGVGGVNSILKPSRNEDFPMDMSTNTIRSNPKNIPNLLQNSGLYKTGSSKDNNDNKLNGHGQWNPLTNSNFLRSNYIIGPETVTQDTSHTWTTVKGRGRKKSIPMRVSTSTSSTSPGIDDGAGSEADVEIDMDDGVSKVEDLTLERGNNDAD